MRSWQRGGWEVDFYNDDDDEDEDDGNEDGDNNGDDNEDVFDGGV